MVIDHHNNVMNRTNLDREEEHFPHQDDIYMFITLDITKHIVN